jgi:archaellum component FlaG (FlaF/FlaG flagellin family)
MSQSRTFPSGFRFFSSQINLDKAHPAFQYIWDKSLVWTVPNGQSITGGARPVVPEDLAANISVSGLSLSVGSVAVTGGQVAISNNPGVTVLNPTYAQYNTGGYIGITGTPNFSFTNSTINVAITGQPTHITGSVSILGNSLNVSSTGVTNVSGSIFSSYIGSTSVSNNTPSGANGVILPANTNRKSWFIQNNGTGYLYLKFGTNASSTSYNMILKGAGSTDAYDGSVFLDDGARWKGDVSISGQFNIPLNYINWELN